MRLKFFFLSETDIPYLSQVRFEQFTTITLSKSSNCFFLNLTNTLTCEAKLIADFFQCHFLLSDTEKHLNDFFFPIG